jgi:uncharacterized membrane protein YGL010W
MATAFRPATALLKQYAAYHRDRRNIATHFLGVPMIVLGVLVLLSLPSITLGVATLTPALVAFIAVTAWYLTRGQLALGLAVSLVNAMLLVVAQPLSEGRWWIGGLGWGLGLFVFGWVVQYVGHWYEGRKPAFADDVVGLLVAPMFVVLEALAMLGYFKGLIAEIEQHVGPTHIRNLAHPATR